MDRIAPGAPTGGARTNMRPAGRWELARHALATDEQRPIDLRPSTATIQGTVPRPGAATVVGTRTPRAGARGARRTRAPAFRVARRILRERLQRPPPCRRRPRAPRAAVPRAEIASVVVRAPEPFGLGTLPLRGDPALDRPPARSRGATRGWRRRDRGGEDLRHPLQGGLSVPKLRPLLRRRHRQHAIHEPAGKPIQRTPPLHGTQSARSGHIDAQLHAGVGRVDRLSAGSGRVAEPPAQLARRHQDRTADAERTDHAGSMNAGIAEPALSVSSPAS